MKPILFSTPMVQAILAGNKTQTRRVTHPQPNAVGMIAAVTSRGDPTELNVHDRGLAPYRPGDILWVRETWTTDCGMLQNVFSGKRLHYCAECKEDTTGLFAPCKCKKRPSIFMPRAAARIFLRVTDVQAERVQDISTQDAIMEGVNFSNGRNVGFEEKMRRSAIDRYREIWDDINGKRGPKGDRDCYSWERNPWVWVYTFERITKEEAEG